METRLKQDVLREARDYGSQIMVAHEDDDYQVVQKWEPVTEVDVQTPLDVYRELEGHFPPAKKIQIVPPCSLQVPFEFYLHWQISESKGQAVPYQQSPAVCPIACLRILYASSVLSLSELEGIVAEDGYDVDYQRVPVTDEKAPKERDFVFLVRRLWQQPAGTALVFNCQMGRGRTSTGMIIATLLLLRQACNPLNLPATPQRKFLGSLEP